MKKSTQRDTNTVRVLAIVRFGHRPHTTKAQTHRQDLLQYTAPLASTQCNQNNLLLRFRLFHKVQKSLSCSDCYWPRNFLGKVPTSFFLSYPAHKQSYRPTRLQIITHTATDTQFTQRKSNALTIWLRN